MEKCLTCKVIIANKEEIARLNFDEYTLEEIKHLISCGLITEFDVASFYGNEFWDDVNI